MVSTVLQAEGREVYEIELVPTSISIYKPHNTTVQSHKQLYAVHTYVVRSIIRG